MRFEPLPFRVMVAALTRCTLRRYLSNKAGLLGGLMLLLIGLPLAVRLAGAAAHHWSVPDTRLGLLGGFFVFVAALPLVTAGAFGDSSLAERLRRYPVSPATRAAALALVGLVELPTLLALPALATIAIHGGWRALLVAPLLVATAVGCGQALLLLGGALVERRRVREVGALLLPVGAALALVVTLQSPGQAAAMADATRAPMRAGLSMTPPGLAEAALDLSPGVAALAVGGLVLWVGATAAAVVALTARERAERIASGARGRYLPLLPGVIGAMASKELRQLVREPLLRGGLTQGSVALLAVTMITLQPPNDRVRLLPAIGTGAFAYLLLWGLQLICNQWGADAAAGRLLWGFPTARWRWIVGKNLAHGVVLAGLVAGVLGMLCTAASVPWRSALGFLSSGMAGAILAVALGNLLSPLLPFASVPPPGRTEGRPAGQSFGTSLLYYGLVAVAATIAAQRWAWLAAPLLYAVSVPVAERLLRRREREVGAALCDEAG